MPVTATRRFVLGTVIAGAAVAKGGTLLQPQTADPYASGPVQKGRGVVETVLEVTDEAFGVKGDGILLGDLTVQAGSTTITSGTAPFTSTERDKGKLVFWRGADDTVGTGTIAAVQSPTQAVLQQPASVSARSDGGPNTNGAVGTDNTAGLNAAFAAAQAASAKAGATRRQQVTTVEVHISRGVFLTRALDPFEQPGVTVTGEGRFSSVIASADDAPWMQLGTFSASPPDAFQGTATDWTFRDLQFINPVFRSGSSEGKRTGRAIQDNGSGGTRILDCMFTGLEYGFCGAYGSDFSQVRDCVFYLCDTGYYFGPGSQQLDIAKTDASQCREGAVFEGAPQWHIGNASSFEDPTVAAITIEAPLSGKTRLGLAADVGGAFYSGKFLIDGATWFETNSGGGGRVSPRLIWVRGDGPFNVPVEGVVVRDAYVIAGGTQVPKGHNCFLEYDSALVSDEPVVIEDLVVNGTYLNSVFRMTGSAATAKPRISGVARPAEVALTQGHVEGAKIVERDGSTIWPARLSATADGVPTLQLQQIRGQGTAPLLATRAPDSDDVLSGIAGGGALIGAFDARSSSGDAVVIDAARCNYFSCTLTGGRPSTTITNAPKAATQHLVVEFVASGGDRQVRWPTDCRFARGSAPTTIASGTRTSVTLAWHPAQQVWVETARAVRVGA
ncbi:hypothetical protein [uncultured Amnibacterium sp.]|uniref:hypothetical protein n=1 Tax=uncultured Amnibacterium sp. TaxID=1631851 RepID=UPI0035CC09FB